MAGAIGNAELGDFGFQWHLTDRCNLRCRHCYQASFTDRTALSAGQRVELADRILQALAPRPVHVSLTGGEPLLVPDLFELVDHLAGFEHLAQLDLITNGTLADAALLESIAARERIDRIKVSLESVDPEENDRVRGPGSWAQLRGLLPAWRATGKPVILMVTLGRWALARLEQVIDFARAEGLAGVMFERFVPLGQGGRLRNQVPDSAAFRAALLRIARAAGAAADPDDLRAFQALWIETGAANDGLHGAGCNLGAGSMALMPDGSVFPCRRLPHPIGNALSEPFDVILERLAAWTPVSDGAQGACDGCRALARALGLDDPSQNHQR